MDHYAAQQGNQYDVDYKPIGGVPQETHIHEGARPRGRISGKWLEISFSFLVMTVPMILFSALLLGLIFAFRVTQRDFVSDNLKFTVPQVSGGAVYVNMSATLLITIASWSSTIAPILVGFAVTLLSYPVSKGLLSAASQNQPGRLPTPYQLGLIIRMNTASAASSMWHWLRYRMLFKKGRSDSPPALNWMTIIIVISTVLSLLVFATDTWLHIATKTVQFVQVEPAASLQNLTFELFPTCTQSNNSLTAAMDLKAGNVCVLNPGASVIFLMGGQDAFRVLNNASSTRAAKSVVRDDSTYFYMGNADQPRLADMDFSARSFAVQTHCEAVTTQCIDEGTFFGASTPYDCPFNFKGDLAREPFAISFYTDETRSDNNTVRGVNNPYYFAVASDTNTALGGGKILDDPEVVQADHGGTVAVLSCSSTVYDVEYSSINGTITRWETTLSNSSLANIMMQPPDLTGIGTDHLKQSLQMGALANTSAEYAEIFAQQYSRVAISLSSNAYQSVPGIEAQTRSSILVARIPYGPLAALILANMLLVVLGVGLTIAAIMSANGDSAEVQARLSVPALVAQCFENAKSRVAVESTEDMFDEYDGRKGQKVGVIRTEEGGWTFGTWRPNY